MLQILLHQTDLDGFPDVDHVAVLLVLSSGHVLVSK